MREIMDDQVSRALRDFTHKYLEHWLTRTGRPPASQALFGVPSPCAVDEDDQQVYWQPRAPADRLTLDGVERALELRLRPEAWAFYGSQLAGDMLASFEDQRVELLQIWSDADGIRIQENLIGHLLMQKRLKLAPTVFIATTESELTLVSMSNLTGEVLLEDIGSRRARVLSANLVDFLTSLAPRIT